MSRNRNPRFAPESLERKLSPSGLVPAAQVAPAATNPGFSVSYGTASLNPAGTSAASKPISSVSTLSFDEPMDLPPPPPIPPVRFR